MPSVERPPRDWSARIATLEASPDARKAALGGGGGSGAIETPEQNVRVRPLEVHGDPLDNDDDDDAGGRGADDDEVFVRSAGVKGANVKKLGTAASAPALSVFSRDDVKVASAAAVRRAQLKEKGAIPTKTRRDPVKMGRLT